MQHRLGQTVKRRQNLKKASCRRYLLTGLLRCQCGAHMVGAEVTELIQGFVIAMGLETTEEELMRTIFPHPTLSEMMHESVLDAYGRVIHM